MIAHLIRTLFREVVSPGTEDLIRNALQLLTFSFTSTSWVPLSYIIFLSNHVSISTRRNTAILILASVTRRYRQYKTLYLMQGKDLEPAK